MLIKLNQHQGLLLNVNIIILSAAFNSFNLLTRKTAHRYT